MYIECKLSWDINMRYVLLLSNEWLNEIMQHEE